MSRKERQKIVGQRLMTLRGEQTQKEVAEALGISECCFRHYESGRCSPKDLLKKPIADYFNVDISALFFIFDQPFLFPEKSDETS
jgi:DNA-binding XRE family transcriptional regulator